jgi:feruloyl esterase
MAMTRRSILLAGLPVCAGLALAGGLAARSAMADTPGSLTEGGDPRCTMQTIRSMLPSIPADPAVREVGIDSVRRVGGSGAHCEVIGHTITRNPGPNQVGWSVLLPDQGFAARYVVMGQGGQGGKILTAASPQANARRYTGAGYVFSSSDTGATTAQGRWSVETDPARLMDREYRGAHVSLLATKALARAYYRMRPSQRLYSYHVGCSAGGAMVKVAIDNYPRDFDGVVAGTAVMSGNNWSAHILQHLLRHPDSWLSPAKLKTIETSVAKVCAGPDGLVRDANACGFRVESLQCQGAETDQCLTPAQIGLAKAVSGPYPVGPGETRAGFTLLHATGWTSHVGNSPPTLTNRANPWAPGSPPIAYVIANSVFRSTIAKDANFDLMRDVNFDDPAFWRKVGGGAAPVSQDPIWRFWRAGGKAILYSGLGENMAPPLAESEFYDAVKAIEPGADRFLRTYQVPGMMHCGGGPGPQDASDRLLDAMTAWVEKGRAPGAVISSRAPAAPERQTLLCPYPQRAKFVGAAGTSPLNAANWKCS